MDTRPEAQLARTTTRRMEVITEADYNDRLREEADVAMIAGKYEDLLDRFQEQINEQKRIEEKLAELRKKSAAGEDAEKALAEFAEAYSEQTHLNERLESMAEEMKEFGRENPVYDFEKELQEKLKQQAEAIQRVREDQSRRRREGDRTRSAATRRADARNDGGFRKSRHRPARALAGRQRQGGARKSANRWKISPSSTN